MEKEIIMNDIDDLKNKIIEKDLIILEAFKILRNQFPNNFDLLSIIGSYEDTMSDEDIYQMLFDWRTTGSSFGKIICSIDDRNN